jgi:CRISPR system Cascade subunit CasA
MSAIEQLSKAIYASTRGYFEEQKMDGGMIASQASGLFWHFCEARFQSLVNACYTTYDLLATRKLLASDAMKAFEFYCPKHTARQLEAWAKCKPNLFNYLNPKA